MTSFTVYFDIQLSIRQHSATKGFKLGETRVIGRIVIVLGELVQPYVKGLAKGATMLLPYILPDAEAWPSWCAGDFDLAAVQGLILIAMTQFLVPAHFKKVMP